MIHSAPPPSPVPRGRRNGPARYGRWGRWGSAALVMALVVGYAVLRELTGAPEAACGAGGPAHPVVLQQDQAANAATIAAVAVSRGLPERALTTALATAMQESSLRDLPGGDRDSLGLFQQRPSQGWGTPGQIMDPVYAANRFFDDLVRIPGYTALPVTAAAQQVQRSGYPQAYARHAADAAALAAAWYGQAPSLSCQVVVDGSAGDAAAVGRRLAREFGGARVAVSGATVTLPAGGAGVAGHGWAAAQWAVAQAATLRIAEVDYRGLGWRAADSAQGWTAAGRRSEDVRIRVQR